VTLLSLVQSDRGQNIPVGGCFGQMQQPEASVLLRGNAAVPARSRALMDWNGSTSVRLRRRHSPILIAGAEGRGTRPGCCAHGRHHPGVHGWLSPKCASAVIYPRKPVSGAARSFVRKTVIGTTARAGRGGLLPGGGQRHDVDAIQAVLALQDVRYGASGAALTETVGA
jgi:hypothetical protein